MTDYHPSATDVTDGIPDAAFDTLTATQRRYLVSLMARVSERSYRRGFQQGVTIAETRPDDIRADLHDWRYGPATYLSPWADCPRVEPADQRLFTENPGLRRLGFWETPWDPQELSELAVDRAYRARRPARRSQAERQEAGT